MVTTPFDCDTFGHWLSGFTDGEGSFLLSMVKSRHSPRLHARSGFVITLRADDFETLNLIQSYLQCGNVRYLPKAGSYSGKNGKPQYRFEVSKLASLSEVVIPHFTNYPLRSKKATDFSIWKEGVLLHTRVSSRGRGGCRANWRDEEVKEYALLASKLKDNRIYVPFPSALP